MNAECCGYTTGVVLKVEIVSVDWKEVLKLFRVYRADIVLTSAPAKEGCNKQRSVDIMTTQVLIASKMTEYCCKAILAKTIVGSLHCIVGYPCIFQSHT